MSIFMTGQKDARAAAAFFFVFFCWFRAFAQPAPVVQEYYLPYPENQVFNALKSIFPGNTACGWPTTVPNVSAPLRSYISISPYLANTIIYYDHWEDGYETELTAPTQPTTRIWGDGNTTNGIPPSFGTDAVNAGSAIILVNNIDPSNLTLLDFDARDRIGTSRPVSITKSHWASGSESLLAGTMLVYPVNDWGTDFRMPLGQDVASAIQSFSYSGISIMARANGTAVRIDANADGVFETSVTLNEGESYHVNGGILKGARVQSSLPVQVYMTAGDVCDNYENRWFNIPSSDRWGNYYFGPLSGVDKIYHVYNPSASPITIKRRDANGFLADQTIAANGYATTTGVAGTGFQFYSTDGSPFLVLGMNDASTPDFQWNDRWDWGSALLPSPELTQQVIVGWAPGHDPNFVSTENSSPVWLTVGNPSGQSLGSSIRVCVDYDGDAAGPLTDGFGRQYDVALNLNPLAAHKIYDPDGDQTNMVAYVCDGSKALISAVWGEDPATASPGSPGLDLGNAIPGINPFYAYKNGRLFTDGNGNGLFNIGDVVEFKIGISNPGLVPTSGNYNVRDALPTWVTYVNNSTQLTTPTGASAIADAGTTNFPLDEGGRTVSLSLNPGQEGFVTFRATVNAKPPGDGCMTNVATVSKDGIVYTPDWSFCVVVVPEICGNFIDDDQDGKIDCADPDCFAISATGGQFCLGSTISLTATGGTGYLWTGPSSFFTTTQNPTRPTATAAMSGTYTVIVTGSGCIATATATVNVANCAPSAAPCDAVACAGANLISAGSFENFSTASPGFTSDFQHVNCGGVFSGNYSIVQSAANCNPTWPAAPDRTIGNGNGKYMAVDFATTSPGQNLNGNTVSGELFTSAPIPVSAGRTYCFSAYFLKLCAACPGEPDVRFLVNGIQVGTVAGSTFTAGAWTRKGFSFSTADFGNPPTITVSIAQNAFGDAGFDLGLDDVELRATLSGTTPTVANDAATVCNANPLTINVLANDASYVASTLTISSQPSAAAGTASISGTSVVFTPVPGFTGQASFTYSVCGAAANGCCATGTVTVNVATVTASAASETICAGQDLHLTASGGNTYAWTGPNGFTAATNYATINNATVAATGTYTVTVTNAAGCTATATAAATVNACATNRDPECDCN